MRGMARLLAETGDLPPMPDMTVEQALARRNPASRLASLVAAGLTGLGALLAGFAQMFARAAHSHRAATTITIVLSLVFSAWLAAMILPERGSVPEEKPVAAAVPAMPAPETTASVTEPPRIAPARGPPAWDDPPIDLGPDWEALAQPSPEYVFNQEVQW